MSRLEKRKKCFIGGGGEKGWEGEDKIELSSLKKVYFLS